MKTFKTLLTCIFFSTFVNARETGGPYTADANTILLMHFNNSQNVG